jgi:PAS domain S-box-containing protein
LRDKKIFLEQVIYWINISKGGARMNNPSSATLASNVNWGPLKIAGLYLLIGGLWILFSDRLAARITTDPALLTRISLYKGWGFIFVTAFLLYWLIRQDTDALSSSEKQMRLITDALPALISYVDSDRCYQFSNKAYEEWFGHEAHGKHLEEMLGMTAYKTISGYVDRVLAGEFVTYETELPYKDGGERFVNATYIPDGHGNGQVKGFFALIQDITERKEAEEELRQWADAFEGCAHGIAIDDPSTNRITVCNAAFASMHKCRVEDLVGTAILSLYVPDDHEHVRRSIERADQIGHSRFEARMLRKDGSTFPLQMDVVSVRGDDGDLLHRVVTAVDITERKQAVQVLHASEAKFSILFEKAAFAIALSRLADGVIVNVNEAFERAFGYTKQEVIGKTSLELGINPDSERRALILAALKEQGSISNLESTLHTKSGDLRIFSMNVDVVDIGDEKYILNVTHDITERKQVEAALQRARDELEFKVQERTVELSQANALLQALMDHMPDHIYFKDTECRFIRNSKSQASMLGLSDPAQIVGKTDFDFFPHAAQAHAEEQEVMRSGQPLVDFEEHVVWPDGRETWVSTTKVPFRNPEGQIIGILGISRDITERKRGEQAVRQLNADLKEQATKLEGANKELEAFSYSVSHDLRAPLRAIDGFTRILLEDYEPLLDQEGKRVCEIIRREAQHMGELIDDLLAFSRLGRKEMHFTKIDMKAMAGSVFDELMTTQSAAGIDFQIHRLPSTSGDPILIRQVWVNLLSNAIKFSSRKERAMIEVGSKHSEAEHIYYVRDLGAGFEMEYVDKLFGVFQRLHGEKEFEGTGVGLAIVKRVVNRHGGRVWAEGEVNKGATFYFALPRKREST